MAKKIKDGFLFYHITAINNLPTIFTNGLCSRHYINKTNFQKINIARDDIIQKRKELEILNYVPFHFFEPTAFAGVIFKDNPGITFCTITIKRSLAKDKNFKICTAHPLSLDPIAEILPYNEGINAINWEKMEERNYNDDVSKNVCMAECLATSPVLPKDFHTIFVPDENTKYKVEQLAKKIIGAYTFNVTVNNTISGIYK